MLQMFLDPTPWGGYVDYMEHPHKHRTHPKLITRLKRAQGHLRHVIEMLEDGKPCSDIAVQMQAVEKAVGNAKRVLIHDHIDHCIGTESSEAELAELRALAKLL